MYNIFAERLMQMSTINYFVKYQFMGGSKLVFHFYQSPLGVCSLHDVFEVNICASSRYSCTICIFCVITHRTVIITFLIANY